MDDLHRRLVKNALPRGLQNLHTMHAAIRIQGHRQAQAARYSPLQCFLGVMTVAGLLNTGAPLVQIRCIDGVAGGPGGETMDARAPGVFVPLLSELRLEAGDFLGYQRHIHQYTVPLLLSLLGLRVIALGHRALVCTASSEYLLFPLLCW